MINPETIPQAEPRRANPARRGAYIVDGGVDFCVEAPHATDVYVCLFTNDDEIQIRLNPDNFGMWTGHIAGIGDGQRYGYRAAGRWDPSAGLYYNPKKLLLDPYARGLARTPVFDRSLFALEMNDDLTAGQPLTASPLDSAAHAPLGVVVADAPSGTSLLRTPWDRTVIYEAHVVSLTKQMPGLPEELRGTYAGVAHPVTVDYLKKLGVTAIELLPIHAKMHEPFLAAQGRENFWGYNTLNFFTPEPSYAMASNQAAGPHAVIDEVKGMISLLHDAGIEVILDVVYNHSCEGGIHGPSVSWRGLDPTIYYRHDSARPDRLKDTTGTGNSFDFRRESVIRMTLDSLRHWVTEYGVDGFRFDLAVTLSREGDNFNPHHPLFVAMATDPVLADIKLINEPWDVGHGGWRTGQFPVPTADWNDRFRDTLRSFWVNEPGRIMNGDQGSDPRDLATRLAGSADLFAHGRLPGGRGVRSSINFITAHDGFTLRDLCAYNTKHNEDNGEDNRDGNDNNRSWNHGVEGAADEATEAMRRKSERNLMACLIFAAGTPMITAGDEVRKTQLGNNNAYCQNSELSWINWDLDEHAQNMLDTTSFLLKVRRDNETLRPTSFFSGTAADEDDIPDLEWLDSQGNRMPDYLWFDPNARLLQALRSGHSQSPDALLVINGKTEAANVHLPVGRGYSFKLVWTSEWETPIGAPSSIYEAGVAYRSAPLSVTLFLSNPA